MQCLYSQNPSLQLLHAMTSFLTWQNHWLNDHGSNQAALPSATKLAAVLGTMLPKTPMTTLPAGLPPTARSKNTLSVTVVVTLGSALHDTTISAAFTVHQRQLTTYALCSAYIAWEAFSTPRAAAPSRHARRLLVLLPSPVAGAAAHMDRLCWGDFSL